MACEAAVTVTAVAASLSAPSVEDLLARLVSADLNMRSDACAAVAIALSQPHQRTALLAKPVLCDLVPRLAFMRYLGSERARAGHVAAWRALVCGPGVEELLTASLSAPPRPPMQPLFDSSSMPPPRSVTAPAVPVAGSTTGPRLLELFMGEAVAFNLSQLAGSNLPLDSPAAAAVQEAAAAVIAESALKLSAVALAPHVFSLTTALLHACSTAAAWPARDVAVLALGRLRLRFGGDACGGALAPALLERAFDASRAVREHAAAVLGEVAADLAPADPEASAALLDSMRKASVAAICGTSVGVDGELSLALDGALFLLRARLHAAASQGAKAASIVSEDAALSLFLEELRRAGERSPVALRESACRILIDIVHAAGKEGLRPHLDALLPLVRSWSTAAGSAAERACALVASDLLRELAAAIGPSVLRARLAALAPGECRTTAS